MRYLFIILFLTSCTQEPRDVVSVINMSVNRSMWYVTDSVAYEKSDHWVSDCKEYGDCEDYALCKARKLVNSGVVKSRLDILVIDANGVSHAVLVVDKQRVLDNRHDVEVEFKKFIENNKPFYSCNLSGYKEIYVRNSDNSGYDLIKEKLEDTSKCAQSIRSI